jgi:hypothetical protein
MPNDRPEACLQLMTLLILEQKGSETGCEIIQEDLPLALQNLITASQIVSSVIHSKKLQLIRLFLGLDLSELKERAAQVLNDGEGFIGHHTKSLYTMKLLTADNIGYEVFSPFAAAFEAIRKVRSLSTNLTN